MLPTWLIIVIVILALAALTFGALAIRRRRLEGPGGPDASTQAESKPGDPGTPDPRPRGSRRPRRPVRVRPRRRGLTAHGSNSVYLTVIFSVRLVTVPPPSSGSPVGYVHASRTAPLLGKARWTSK